MRLKCWAIAHCLVLATAGATAGTLTFDGLAPVIGAGSINIGNMYVEGDFQINGTPTFPMPQSGFHVLSPGNANWTGTPGLTYFGVGASIELTAVSGALFNVDSISISRGDSNSGLIPVMFTGTKADGSTVTQTYRFSDAIHGKNEIFSFGTEFQAIRALAWQQRAEWHQFDNLSVSVVPEPASVWLFTLALPLLIRASSRSPART